MEWVAKAQSLNYLFEPTSVIRSSQINQLETLLSKQNCRPFQIKTYSPENFTESVPVTCFDFKAQLLSLLIDNELTHSIENLDVNVEDPFSKFFSSKLTCVNSGSWYQKAWDFCVKNENDFLIPIVMACDHTQVSTFGKT